MRFSESDFIVPETSGLAPSFAMKILATGRHSINVLTRVDMEPSDSWNFWADSFTHRVNRPFENECKKKTIERKFQFNDELGKFASFETGISDMAKYNQDGTNVTEPLWPYELIFQPYWQLRYNNRKA